MRFNFSRFLVRLRQFWTRKRLVPVLGFTALALFFLNFWVFIGHQFNNAPFNASYVTGGSFFSSHFDRDAGTYWHVRNPRHKHGNSHFWGRDHVTSRRKHCKSKKKDRQTYEHYFEVKRFNEEAERFQRHADQYRQEIDRLQEEIQHDQLHGLSNELELLEKRIKIKKLAEDADFDITIMVDGTVIDVP